MKKAILYIVSTPIGNLDDISKRALLILNTVSRIICEDTRHSTKLLKHYNINKNLISLHKFNESARSQEIISLFEKENLTEVALISDAGSPCVSDPGTELVRMAHRHNIQVQVIPGPSSLTAAISASGIGASLKIFYGFIDKNNKKKKDILLAMKALGPCHFIFFDSPKRVIDSLYVIEDVFSDKIKLCLSKEISKKYENHFYGELHDVLSRIKEYQDLKGEYVVSLEIPKHDSSLNYDEDYLRGEIAKLLEIGASLKKACAYLSEKKGLGKKDLYNLYLSGQLEKQDNQETNKKG